MKENFLTFMSEMIKDDTLYYKFDDDSLKLDNSDIMRTVEMIKHLYPSIIEKVNIQPEEKSKDINDFKFGR